MARTGVKQSSWIGRVFFADLLAGLRLTLGYMMSKTVTHHYPDHEKWVPYQRHRGHHFMNTNEAGEVNCVACGLCSKICPCNCITVIPFENDQGDRRPKVFDIDLARCLYCGLCEDACPADAIKLGQEYEVSTTNRATLKVHLEDLIAAPRKSEDGGDIKPAKLDSAGSQHSILRPESDAGRDWWSRVRRD
ncbi:NADH-quinone oxidoreductase subunit I [Sedimentitalea sp. CY04]|uniref:NADH-quinone oxidoreductase subunit I n=1 Tax=Parasedimentitalea denitrificans TaxID=2211118 RepID=A0ABX0W292_9RHOB|nr:NADH-quinone oxidoreductase subunit I [Sedimentitalea sp. CY04]NIZ59747.1 NADH-quinone oxidoreductase subunit I [Sedimentitalea sp. CY04]